MSLSFFKEHRGSLKRIIHFTSAEVLCVQSPSTCIHHKTCVDVKSRQLPLSSTGLWFLIFPFKPSNCSVIVALLQSMQFCSIKLHCIVWWTTLKYNYIYIKHTCSRCSAIQVKLNSTSDQHNNRSDEQLHCCSFCVTAAVHWHGYSCSFHISLYRPTVENLFIVVTYHILWLYWYSHWCYCSQTVIFCYFIMYTFFCTMNR